MPGSGPRASRLDRTCQGSGPPRVESPAGPAPDFRRQHPRKGAAQGSGRSEVAGDASHQAVAGEARRAGAPCDIPRPPGAWHCASSSSSGRTPATRRRGSWRRTCAAGSERETPTAKKEAVAELREMAKRAREVMVELGMRRPRGLQASQDEFSTNQPHAAHRGRLLCRSTRSLPNTVVTGFNQ